MQAQTGKTIGIQEQMREITWLPDGDDSKFIAKKNQTARLLATNKQGGLMKKTPFIATAIGLLLLLSTPAFATVWTDIHYTGGITYLNTGDTHDYRHDITDDGFTPGSDSVSWYQVELYLTDDYSWSDWDDNMDFGTGNDELVEVTTGWFDLQAGLASYEVDFNIFDPITHSRISVDGLIALNTFGMLDVRLSAIGGDFYFVASKLRAADTVPVPVSEPGTIMLVGIGLVGLANVGRRKFKQ